MKKKVTVRFIYSKCYDISIILDENVILEYRDESTSYKVTAIQYNYIWNAYQ